MVGAVADQAQRMSVVPGLKCRVGGHLNHGLRLDLDDRGLDAGAPVRADLVGLGMSRTGRLQQLPDRGGLVLFELHGPGDHSNSLPRYRPATSSSGRRSDPVTAPMVASAVSRVFHLPQSRRLG